MAILTIEQLKSKFERGDFPRQQDFWDLIDTLNEDKIFFGSSAPEDNVTYPLWFNTSSDQLSIFYNNSWINIGDGAPGADGSDGADGADGLSAYEVALENGFSGTEQQWLSSLIGPAGADSTVPGPQGDQGTSGVISVISPITNIGTSTEANIGIDLSSYYTSSQVDSAIAAIVDAAPGTLNTLNELAAAINDDASYAATMTTALGNKQDKVSGVSDTEIGYLDGVTSAIQTQINSKAPVESPTFTGTVSGVTKSHVGLGDADNTSDAEKPVSTAQQTALDLKANLANPTLTSSRLSGNTAIEQVFEDVTIVDSAAAATINYDLLTNHAITLYTVNSSANWTLNIRGNSSTTLNSIMSIGQSLTVVFIATNGVTPYYQAGLQIDGQAVTPKWQGGTSPTAGNASSLDSYSVTIIKTANAQFNVLESQVRFA
jgi:hypothetical protein